MIFNFFRHRERQRGNRLWTKEFFESLIYFTNEGGKKFAGTRAQKLADRMGSVIAICSKSWKISLKGHKSPWKIS
jgi:hypothetical protein